MNKIPKISYEALEQVLNKFNSVCKKIKNNNLSSKALIDLLEKYIRELKAEQPAVYDWAVSTMDAYQMLEKPLRIEELFLFLIIFSKALKIQQEIDNLNDLFSQ